MVLSHGLDWPSLLNTEDPECKLTACLLRVEVVGNVLWDNGQVPKSSPESRQPYAGLTVNTADTVEVRENFVKTELHQDYAYMAFSSNHVTGENNWVQ